MPDGAELRLGGRFARVIPLYHGAAQKTAEIVIFVS